MSENESLTLIEPSAEFVGQATISGMAAYQALCAEAQAYYTGYWARLARQHLSWKTPFTQVLDESNSPFFKWVPKADDAALRALCSGTFGDVPVPRLGDFVENLPVIQQLLLKISLANIGRPPLLVVGRLDDVTSDDDQSQVLRRLVELGKGQSIIVGCSNRPPADWNIKVVDLSDMSAVPTYSTSGQEASQ